MNPNHAHFAEWDAAYVLGALSATERREYEEHLVECVECSRAVAELAPTVGLLSRVPADRFAADGADAEDGPHPDARADLVVLAHRRASRRRVRWIGAAAAAVLAIAAVAVPVAITSTAENGAVHALSGVVDAPLEASVRLTDVAWGTRIDMVCSYSGAPLDAPDDGWPYALAVVSADGEITTLSTWRAMPGSTTQLSAGTDLAVADIGAIEIRTIDGDDVLMRYDVGE